MSTTAWAVHHTWAATAGNHPDTPPLGPWYAGGAP